MKHIVLRSGKLLNVAFFESEEIDTAEAETYRKEFLVQHPGEIYGYWLDGTLYRKFLQAVKHVDDANFRRHVAIGLQPGRQADDRRLDLSMEAIVYDKDASGIITAYERLSDEFFFGKVASDFRIDFDNHSGNPNRDAMNKFVQSKGPNKTEIILVEFKELSKFSNTSFDKLLIEFGINGNNRLTAVITRYLNRSIVVSSSSGKLGLFLDDHDLLP